MVEESQKGFQGRVLLDPLAARAPPKIKREDRGSFKNFHWPSAVSQGVAPEVEIQCGPENTGIPEHDLESHAINIKA